MLFVCYSLPYENSEGKGPERQMQNRTFLHFLITCSERRGGLMVSALESGSSSPGWSPGRDTALCSWARHFTVIVSLFTQVYQWVPINLLLGVTL